MSKRIHVLKAEEMSLANATKPLLVVSRLVGMNPKSNCQKMYTVTILTYEICLLSYVWSFRGKNVMRNYYFNIFVLVLKDFCLTSSILVVLIFSIINRKRFMVPVKEFADIDRSLKNLGGVLDNRSFYRSVIAKAVCFVLVIILCGFLDLYAQLFHIVDRMTHRVTGLGCSYHLIINIVCTTADYSFSATLSILRKRFEQINLIIRRAGNRRSHLRMHILEDLSERLEDDVLGKLRVLRRQYHELWLIAKRVNRGYGPHLLVGAANSIAVITVEIWKTFYVMSSNRDKNLIILIGNTVWVFFYITRMCLLAQACESTITEAKTTADVLQELGMSDDHSPEEKDEMRDFFSQILWEAQNFTACKFFDINFSLICGILGAVWTYLVILIQMDNSYNCSVVEFTNTSAPVKDRVHS